MIVDFNVSHDVDHGIEAALVEVPTDDAPELELVAPAAPTWRDRPRALPRRDVADE